MKNSKQTTRILAHLLDHRGDEVSALTLHKHGSGKPMGFVASLSRRISDARENGWHITCRSEWVNGQRQTYYTLH